MLKFMRIVMVAAAAFGIAQSAASASMLGSASRIAGASIVAKVEANARDRQAKSFSCRTFDCDDVIKPAFSAKLYLTMTLINQRINEAGTRPMQLRSYWPMALLKRKGEEIARAKRDRLLREGLPGNALRLVTLDEEAGRRMVLVVETTAGDFVLDSQPGRIVRQDVDERTTASTRLVLPHFRMR